MKSGLQEDTLKVVAIIQARMGSTRLPGKVLKDLAGDTVLARVVNRTRRAKSLNEVVIATTTEPADDVIIEECERLQVATFRGSQQDVLDRYHQAAQIFKADAVVRITSDCPLIDPDLIDMHVKEMLRRWFQDDFVTNMTEQTYPLGLAVEAMPMDVLHRMWRLSDTAELKEHVTTLAYMQPQLFRIRNLRYAENISHLRWTLDTKEDLELLKLIFTHFAHDDFSWEEVLALVRKNPHWSEINQHIAHKNVG